MTIDRAIRWWPLVACMVGIFLLSSMPKLPETLDLLDRRDKVQHLIAYSVLGVLALRSSAWRQPATFATATAAFAFSILFGASDEWHQSFVPGRDCDIGDWLFDAVGSAIGIGALILYSRSGREMRQI